MFNSRSKAAFFATLIAVAYGIYAIVYWVDSNSSTTDSAEAIGAGIATLLVLPHLLITWLGIIFGIIGFFTRKTGFQLTAAILYAVGAAVIGGTSLFGGKGKMRDAILGGLVVAVIDNGMGLLGYGAGIQFLVTGAVLLVSAGVDAFSRKGALK